VVGGDRARASGKRASAAGSRRVAGGEPISAPDAEGRPAPLLLALSLSNPESYHVHPTQPRGDAFCVPGPPHCREPCHVSTRAWGLQSGLWALSSATAAMAIAKSTARPLNRHGIGTSASAYQTAALCTLHPAPQSTRPASNPSSSPNHNQ
jgi:hypothetical protein